MAVSDLQTLTLPVLRRFSRGAGWAELLPSGCQTRMAKSIVRALGATPVENIRMLRIDKEQFTEE